jgi:hypothetical protein
VPQGAHPEKPHRLCRAGLATTQELGLPERKTVYQIKRGMLSQYMIEQLRTPSVSMALA